MNVWELILKSNTFNFIVLVIIIAFILKKLNVSLALENLKNTIIKRLENSKNEKEKAISELEKAEKAVEHLDNEIQENYKIAEQNVDGVIKQTLINAENQVKHIEQNVQTAILNEEKQISAKILRSTASKALETAKNKIISRLNEHPELHEKYINEAIDDIDKVEIK